MNLPINYIKERAWDYVVCADAGMRFCHSAGILPDLILGDFDSVDEESYEYFQKVCPERMERFPTHKDETDTELALLRAIDAGADAITMIGATGTRLDHVMGNIQMLKLALDRKVFCQIVDAHNRIRMVDKFAELKKSDQFGKYVSLLPFPLPGSQRNYVKNWHLLMKWKILHWSVELHVESAMSWKRKRLPFPVKMESC